MSQPKEQKRSGVTSLFHVPHYVGLRRAKYSTTQQIHTHTYDCGND